jgi:hypothetical protein
MFNRTAIAIAVSTVFLLSACAGGGGGSGANNPGNPAPPTQGGGGGGGGGGGTNPTTPPPTVPYYTPKLVYNHDPIAGNSSDPYNANVYSGNITSSTSEDIIVASTMVAHSNETWRDSNISLLSWQNGTLVDKTSQWFPNGTNRVVGVLDLKMADFANQGRNDLFVVPGTDQGYVNYAYHYRNTGSSFERQTINLKDLWGHDSVVTDLDRDGYKDIVLTSYNANTSFLFNNKAGSFTPYTQQNPVLYSTSSIAAGDFLGNNTTSLIATDPGGPGTASRLYTWSLNGQNFNLQQVSTLPAPRFTLPKWSSYNFGDGQGASHDVRAIAKDFNDDNRTDVIIISRPWLTKGAWPNFSEIQFLKNNGSGSFTDVTDTTLVGYNTATSASYQPRFVDINNDGLEDILVSGVDFTGNTSHQFLLKTSEGKFVSAHTNVLSAFADQTYNMQKMITSSATANTNMITLVKGPDNKLYLLTYVNYHNGSDKQMSFYLSEIGTTNSVMTGQATASLIKQTWPWMSDAQVNSVLAQSSTTWFGMNILDPERAFKPIGSVGIPIEGRGISPIRGYLTGVDLGDGNAVVTDSLGRAFNMNLQPMNPSRLNAFGYNIQHNDQYEMTSHAEYLINGGITTVNGLRVGTDWAGRDWAGMGLNKPTQYTVGVPRWLQQGNWSMGTQYTYLNANPWIAFGGAWGEVNGSGILDNVITYQKNGFTAQASAMYVNTNITPGLVTQVSNIWGAWAETGYRFGNVKHEGDTGLYVGVKPVVLDGSVQARIPTGVDNAGNVVYTGKRLAIQNQTTGYVRALYTNQLDRGTQLRISAIATSTGQYRIMNELRWNLN